MQFDELLSQYLVHLVHRARVRPVAIVHCCKGQLPALAHLSSVHHMGGVQTVHEVGWEGRGLTGHIDGNLHGK